ncbi:fungal specific transcription factor domain-containing protein [Colletotrichum graminicola M1.001]|uniref:Fungal specific transcription factor domain-containing protein n=1 Tax=Colletotrichum graminicola (strain M1.001 / M2 / FGSC 10212) TaxID=645133 RepID=E3QK43_COLGM|nr:fungal specific transcription factor domain-containing protein [Colletotrichum graminicola M1.001]EFQ31231.1 fungal specific transcription factor domain-containing protein [Colletotrichum graminicola M1.001]
MRSSLSCEFCRRSKVKCVNSGTPPCSKCEKSGRSSCALTRPHVTSTRRAAKQARRATEEAPPIPHDHHVDSQRRLVSAPQSRGPASPSGMGFRDDREEMDRHLEQIPKDVVFVALEAFWRKFPELRVIHPSSFMQSFRSTCPRECKALLATVLAMTKTQKPGSDRLRTQLVHVSERYASYACDVLAACILQPPDVTVIQALLILTLYEWGTRNFHKAWMHCGIAIRMMQLLHSSRVAPFPLEISHRNESNSLTPAIETRTFWACFIMDCMVSSGTYNPRVLPKPEMAKLNVPQPPTSTEFALGAGSSAQSEQPDEGSASNGADTFVYLHLDRSFGIMADGFDIYSDIMAFVFNEGRKAPGMCLPENCPWVPTSPVACWRRRLEDWRLKQHRRLHFPDNSVAAHATLGYGESFVYLNLLYYQSIIMLQREYFPFLPTLDMTPQGPIDPPILEAEAPPGWWEQSAKELFEGAANLASILQEASECGVAVMTPFAGFCAFSSCYINLYGFRFPRITCGYGTRAEELMNSSIEYLKEFREVWDLGDGWLKTIQNGSLMYQRATSDVQRYRGRSRFDFSVLHQSVHEFRVVDRSAEHLEEINNVERSPIGAAQGDLPTEKQRNNSIGLNVQTLVDATGTIDDQGLWPNWWSMLEDVNASELFALT